MELFVQYDAHCIDDQPSEKKYGPWHSNHHFSITGVSTTRVDHTPFEVFTVNFDVNFDVIPGDAVYVLYMIYSTGDSFGTSSGNGEILWVFKDQLLAQQALKRWQYACNCHKQQASEDAKQFCTFQVDGGTWIQLNNPVYGYFETLSTLEVVSMILQSPVDDQ